DKPEPAKYKQAELDMQLDGCNWYWYSKIEDADPQKLAPPGVIYFRKKITLPEDKAVKKARIILGVDDEAQIYINEQFGGKVRMEMGKTIHDVSGLLKKGENIIAIFASNFIAGWPANGYNPCGIIAKMEIEFADGSKRVIKLDESWKVTDEKAPADWMTIGFDDSPWQAPEFICKYWEGLYGGFEKRFILPPPPYLRKDFSLSKPIKKAYVYVTALGLYEMRINGQKISDSILTPGWSDFRKRVNYNAYDITGLLKQGDNAAGAILADGWYAGYLAWNRVRERYGKEPRFIAQMEVEYTDGSRETIVTDGSWKASYGPTFEADVLEGVTYDAREEMPG
ncbi:MAG: alpha-L-rhamnosidase N-terminal domain-containing protein, partial [Planctomycetes bacterium]|nr:alpha-L-rhamnosidase N-terminal domain-containing protein [Planctomycetota bacterium]